MTSFLLALTALFLTDFSSIYAEEFADSIFYQRKSAQENCLKIRISRGDYTLKSVSSKHEPFLRALHMNNNAMASFMYYGKPRSEDSFSRLFTQWHKKTKQDIPFTAYTFWNHTNNQFIGYIGFDQCDDNSIEVCYAIMPNCWKQGHGSTLVKTGCTLLINFLKQQGYVQKHNITHLAAHVCPSNQASTYILKKNGFQVVKKTENDDSPDDWIKVQKHI